MNLHGSSQLHAIQNGIVCGNNQSTTFLNHQLQLRTSITTNQHVDRSLKFINIGSGGWFTKRHFDGRGFDQRENFRTDLKL